jgi:3-dehydroquinate dehydratase-1
MLDRRARSDDKPGMSPWRLITEPGHPRVVGSIGSAAALALSTPARTRECCDLVEIRLDALAAEGLAIERGQWAHLAGLPLLFTARRREEGGLAEATAGERLEWLATALPDGVAVDVELASVAEGAELLAMVRAAGLPWVASFHDFERLPDTGLLEDAARRAAAAGAGVFKVAALLRTPDDLARLAGFQLADHGLPVASMGMGPLAAVSRLLCAQCGSVLNYGYLGDTATAPGQWHCGVLKDAIARLPGPPRSGT